MPKFAPATILLTIKLFFMNEEVKTPTENAAEEKGFLDKMKDKFEDIKDKAEVMWDKVEDKAEEIWDKVEDKAEDVWDATKEKAAEIKDKIADTFDGNDEKKPEQK